ncbi:cytochrome P450 [Nonomuraea guangzhouensis]|uniref:Cytochrome P450 n=1 Tax=Nonomuraea guangzhouensis TaxID=1291555 RepID=A0ABW4G875_9ACTN|nr:cytochrome P450 [Nonomuraea guangzhouensis]
MALEDIEIAGQVIWAGEGIIVVDETANRDPYVFPDPDLLDLQRNARLHVSFGYGVHQCLGQPLARMDARRRAGADPLQARRIRLRGLRAAHHLVTSRRTL